ncbi:DEAD/DEAH box helicase [Actinokineospora cianjurensis]|uniref:Superfamily II DNA/RNA helicase n=1 Tax=Actinokineospora cianjurensis TaxID=585224 RepID=A0A421B328_9PSEU|nr:DEAD/DEAH box helicase [Actinokineospora cianjurensis]RLK58764.1 superfamily II DNA/RNA helicase [Actinokineospora cianjurensis]
MAARRPSKTSPSTTGVTPAESPTFAGLGVPAALVDVLAARGIDSPFPIQAATLPDSLSGRDVLGRGRTGSGKTYAFALPLLARLAGSTRARRPGRPRALILAPTRELADQIAASVAPLAEALSLTTLTVYGGVRPGPQVSALRAGVDVLIACPGRLADHIATGHAHLDAVEITVLDEADHMADLGFLPVVTRLLDKTPRGGQRLLFSATLDAGVDVLVRRFLSNPATHSTDPPSSPVTAMTHHVLHVQPAARLPVLVDLTAAPGRAVVFTRTKRGATRLTRQLVAEGVPAVELHGDLGQTARTRNLLAFTEGRASTLVATDIAARGIHVDDVALVIHADPPVEHKAYLHRSGRTARAGASGTVITLMTDAQVADVRDLTRKAGVAATITRLRPGHPLLAELAPGERTFVAPTAKPVTERSPRTPRKPATTKRRQVPSTPKQNRSTPAAAPEVATKTTGAAAFSAGTRAGLRRAR